MSTQVVPQSRSARHDESEFALGVTTPTATHFQAWMLPDEGHQLLIPRPNASAPAVVEGPGLVVVTRTPIRSGYQVSPLRSPHDGCGAMATIENIAASSYDLSRMTFHEWRDRIDTYHPWPQNGTA